MFTLKYMKVSLVFISLVLIVNFLACKKSTKPLISMPVEKYALVTVSPEDSSKFEKSLKKSKNNIEFDFHTGEFKGKIDENVYSGKFDIKKLSSGYTKGFNYSVELAYLSSGEVSSKKQQDFFDQLVKTERIFVSPDKLINPRLIKLDLKSEKNTLSLYMLK